MNDRSKYIVVKDKRLGEIFVMFNPLNSHKSVYKKLFGCYGNKEEALPVVGAGFCTISPAGSGCSGRSETLGVESRKEDTELLQKALTIEGEKKTKPMNWINFDFSIGDACIESRNVIFFPQRIPTKVMYQLLASTMHVHLDKMLSRSHSGIIWTEKDTSKKNEENPYLECKVLIFGEESCKPRGEKDYLPIGRTFVNHADMDEFFVEIVQGLPT